MKIKQVIMYIIGIMVITIFIVIIGYGYLKYQQNKYRTELEQHIDNIYLEGNDKIVSTYLVSDSLTLHKVENNISNVCHSRGKNKSKLYNPFESINFPEASWESESSWSGIHIANTEIKSQLEKNFKYYEIKSSSSPFLIAVEKNDNGYTIYGEEIIGLGLTKEYPESWISIRKHLHVIADSIYEKYSVLKKRLIPKKSLSYSYHVSDDLIQKYANELLQDKYKDFPLRNYIDKSSIYRGYGANFSWSLDLNKKYEMLNELTMKMKLFYYSGESLFFRVNPYYELKLNDFYTKIGSGPIQYTTFVYGNVYQTLFVRSWNLYYSIQENEGVLKSEIKVLFSYILGCVLVLYTVAYVLIIRRKNNIKKQKKICKNHVGCLVINFR